MSLHTRPTSHLLRSPLVAPTITTPTDHVTFELGATDAVLECRGEGDPQPDLQWLRLPDMTLVPSPGLSNFVCHRMCVSVCARAILCVCVCVRVQVRNGSNLVILRVGVADAGQYRCWVANVAGQISRDISVTVIGMPSPSPLL